jgi:hypothetical protein
MSSWARTAARPAPGRPTPCLLSPTRCSARAPRRAPSCTRYIIFPYSSAHFLCCRASCSYWYVVTSVKRDVPRALLQTRHAPPMLAVCSCRAISPAAGSPYSRHCRDGGPFGRHCRSCTACCGAPAWRASAPSSTALGPGDTPAPGRPVSSIALTGEPCICLCSPVACHPLVATRPLEIMTCNALVGCPSSTDRDCTETSHFKRCLMIS